MFYFKIALRQFRRQRMYSIIKIGGFALSIAACILIVLWIRDESSYDRHYAHSDRIFRVLTKSVDPTFKETWTSTQAPLAADLKGSFPDVEKAGRIMSNALFFQVGGNEVRRPDQVQNTYEEGFTLADQGFLDVMGFPMIYGRAGHALDKPNTIVLTKRKADKYFPHEDPLGKVLYLNNDPKQAFTVGGVIPDFASNSSIQYDFFLTLTGHELWKGEGTYWGATNYETYVLLRPGADPAAFAAKAFAKEMREHFLPTMKEDGVQDAEKQATFYSYVAQPVPDIYLRSYNLEDMLPTHGDIRFVWMFGGIALFILVIACINFINLSTARSAGRAREVGLRKVVGSDRSRLVRQFLLESMMYSLLSFVIGLGLAFFLLPYFNAMTGKSLVMPFGSLWFVPMLLLSSVVVGVGAGIYPALYLSSFMPIKVLKGQLVRGSATLRSVLVVFQFSTSIILIIGTCIIYQQMQYILHQKVGFDKDQVMLIQGTSAIKDIQSFKNDLLAVPQVKSVSVGDYLPVNISGSKYDGNGFYLFSKMKERAPVYGQYWIVDYDYLATMGMHLVAGRNFSRDMASDTAAVLINQTMERKLGLGDHAVDSVITNFGSPFRVIGVVADFHFENFRQEIKPVCMALGISPGVVSVRTASTGGFVPRVSGVWKKYVPNEALRYTFMDEGYRNMYTDVTRAGTILTSFTFLAIIIACLGLFAMSSFIAELRTKEIGIRKVLGASIPDLLVLLSRGFVMLVLLSILIATPVAWWGMHSWLQDFAYRQDIQWWIFPAVGGAALGIALLTTGYQSIKTALRNPIDSLKTE